MFFFKALFVRAYYLCALLVTALSVYFLLEGQWRYVGVILIWSPLLVLTLYRRYGDNVGWGQQRETLLMLPMLIGFAAVLLSDHAGAGAGFTTAMWLALSGLFSLLLFQTVMTDVPYGVREPEGDKNQLLSLTFQASGGQTQPLSREGAQVLMFVHGNDCYAHMQVRQLKNWLSEGAITPEQVTVVSAREGNWTLPDGVNAWLDVDGQAAKALGLQLRGGNWPQGDAMRPALAVVSGGEIKLWQVAKNYRLPPCLQELAPRLERALS